MNQLYKPKTLLFSLILVLSVACSKSSSTEEIASVATTTTTTTPPVAEKYLYVASGTCYSGNNTSFTATTASNQVYRINLSTGIRDITLADFLAYPSSAADSPTGIVDQDSDYVYVAVENTTNALRRVQRIAKSLNGTRSTVLDYSHIGLLADTQPIRSLNKTSGGDFLTTRTPRIELTSAAPARIGTPYINPSVAPCLTTNTNLVKTTQLSNGKFVFLHAAASNNRIGIMNTAGGTSCATVQAAPNANSFPTAMFYDSANAKLIVAYAGNAVTTDLNSIYAYSIDETNGTFSSPQKIYDAANYPGTQNFLLYGISDMVYDSTTGYVYISTAISTATTVVNYTIEKFAYTPSNIGTSNMSVLTKPSSASFYNYGNDTKCIAKMMIAD